MGENPGVSCSGADFCYELSGESETEFRRVYGADAPSRIIERSANLTLLADMSPLCIGHLLLVSNRHHLSFAEVAKDHSAEIEQFLVWLLPRYRTTFGEPVVLEHGSAPEMSGSSCITHAHWHILPLDCEDVHRVMMRDGLTSTAIDELSDLVAIGQGMPYFYCADQKIRRVYGVGQRMKRQYLRSVAGELLDIPDPEWDYAVVIRRDSCRATMARTAGWHSATGRTGTQGEHAK